MLREVIRLETFEELRDRRLEHQIPLLQIQKELDCSYSWLRDLEQGRFVGPCIPTWKQRYIDVLERLIEEKNELVEQCR